VLAGAAALGGGAWALTLGTAGWAGDVVGLGVGAAFAILINLVIGLRLVKPMVAAIAGAKLLGYRPPSASIASLNVILRVSII
jgi:hypothetical protein